MRRWQLWGGVAIVAVLAGAYALWARDRAAADDPPATHAPSVADQLRARPLRTRWAAPVCRPRGVVRTAGGAPAADATVVLHAEPLARAADDAEPADVQTRADGSFELPPTAAGAWILVAALPRQRAGVRHVTIRGAADCANLDVALGPPAHAVTGAITDVSGGPVKGALVVVRPAAAPAGPPAGVALAQADGRYELAAEAGDYAISVRHPQYVGVDGQLAVHGPSTFDAVLTPGAQLRGVVRTREHREPVPGARVTIMGGRASGAMGGVTREVVSGDDGTFTATGLGSGRVWITAVGPNHASRDPVELALGIAESRDDIEVLVDPARRIRGLVTHEGKPSADALVSAYLGGDAAGGSLRTEMLAMTGASGELTAETDADGVFELWGLAPGVYEVVATGPHAIPSPAASADATKGDVDALVLALGHGVVIRGRVEPRQVATVTLGGVAAESDRWLAASEIKSAADGTFELHGAEPGETTVYAYAADGAAGETTVEVPAGGASEVVVALEKQGVAVAGRVSDARGKPVAGVYVAGWNAVTGSDGTFSAPDVLPGEYLLSVTDAEDSFEVLGPKLANDTLVVPAAGLPALAITVEARDRTLRGVVVGVDGKPAPDTWVVAVGTAAAAADAAEDPADLSRSTFEWSGRSKIALTDADGRFAIAGLKAGTYDVAAEGNKGHARGLARQVTPDRPVRVQLVALGGLTVVATRGGAPVGRYELEITGPEPDQRTVIAPDGRAVLTGLPPGDYTIRATTDDGSGHATATLAQGANATVTVAIGAYATVTGQIVDQQTGKPLAGISAFVQDASYDPGDDGTTPSWISDANGRFTISNVPPGSGEVLVFAGGDGQKVPFTVGDGGRADVGVIRVEPPKAMPEPQDGDGELDD